METQRQHTTSKGLHPLVYRIIGALAILWVVASWGFFSGRGYTGFTLVVVAVFAIVVVALAVDLGRLWRGHGEAHPQQDTSSRRMPFRDWLSGEFDTWQSRVQTRQAVIEILLPLGVAILGALLIGSVFLLTPPGSAH
jgi:hypothetical protein